MKLYRVLNEGFDNGRTELFLTHRVMEQHPADKSLKRIAMEAMAIIAPKYGETVHRLVTESTPGIMNYMTMPAVLNANYGLVIDLYIDWMDDAEKIAGKVRPTYKPHVLVSYYLCTSGELKPLHHRVLNGEPENIDLTETRESA